MKQFSNDSHPPPPEALRWVAVSVGTGAVIESVSPLAGATSSALHAVGVRHKGRSLALVLRRFIDAEWLRTEPDLARHEASNLQKASRAGVPVPELVAYDESGKLCGSPATLMTRLAGRVELMPLNLGAWLHQLAEAIFPFHALDADDYPWRYFPYINHLSIIEPPGWSVFPALWERAVEIVKGPRPLGRECFIHRDYHPNNVLWQDARVSGVVDWVNSCRGAAGFDVAWCRLNLAQLYGVAEADKFLGAYQSLAGAGSGYHPYWDVMALVEILPGPPGVYEGWCAFGVEHLDAEMMRERLDDYLASVMARL